MPVVLADDSIDVLAAEDHTFSNFLAFFIPIGLGSLLPCAGTLLFTFVLLRLLWSPPSASVSTRVLQGESVVSLMTPALLLTTIGSNFGSLCKTGTHLAYLNGSQPLTSISFRLLWCTYLHSIHFCWRTSIVGKIYSRVEHICWFSFSSAAILIPLSL